MSFPFTWLLNPASYSLVESEMYSIRQFSAFYSRFQVTSGQMTSFPGHFRPPEVTESFPVMWLPPPAKNSLVGSEMYSIREFSAFYSHFHVSFGQMSSLLGDLWSPEFTWLHLLSVTASSCEQQPCRKWNVQYTPAFGLPQPLPGDFRCNHVTSGSLPVTWCHVTSFPFMWLPPKSSAL